MSNTTNAIMQAFARMGLPMADCQVAVGTASAAVTLATMRIAGRLARFTRPPIVGAVTSGTAMLPSLRTYEQNLPVCLINDSGNSLSIYAYIDNTGATNAESLNGTQMVLNANTGRLVVATGTAAVFFPLGILSQLGSGDVTPGVPDFSAANHLNWTAATFA
jgi:hypothetical protein